MSIPPNQFRRDHPWTRFVLLDSSAGPVPSQAKVIGFARHIYQRSPGSHLVNCQRTRLERDGIAKTRR